MKYDVDADFDAPYLEQFGEQIQSLAEAAEDVMLDLSRVNFVDSSGLGALVALHGGSLCSCSSISSLSRCFAADYQDHAKPHLSSGSRVRIWGLVRDA